MCFNFQCSAKSTLSISAPGPWRKFLCGNTVSGFADNDNGIHGPCDCITSLFFFIDSVIYTQQIVRLLKRIMDAEKSLGDRDTEGDSERVADEAERELSRVLDGSEFLGQGQNQDEEYEEQLFEGRDNVDYETELEGENGSGDEEGNEEGEDEIGEYRWHEGGLHVFVRVVISMNSIPMKDSIFSEGLGVR